MSLYLSDKYKENTFCLKYEWAQGQSHHCWQDFAVLPFTNTV